MAFAARVLLGAVFVTSGLLKARDPSWPAAARAFGAPGWAVPLVPWGELGVGIALGAQFRLAGVAALGLLAAFTAMIAVHLARRAEVPCACFGRASARPVSGVHLARNLVLIGLALVGLL